MANLKVTHPVFGSLSLNKFHSIYSPNCFRTLPFAEGRGHCYWRCEILNYALHTQPTISGTMHFSTWITPSFHVIGYQGKKEVRILLKCLLSCWKLCVVFWFVSLFKDLTISYRSLSTSKEHSELNASLKWSIAFLEMEAIVLLKLRIISLKATLPFGWMGDI